MFKKSSIKIWLILIVFLIALGLAGFFSYKYYVRGSMIIQHIEHNTGILNQNQSEIENLLETNSENFQSFEKNLKEPDFELANQNIQELDTDREEIQKIQNKIPELIEMLRQDSETADSKGVYDSAKEVLEIRTEFLENLYLVQKAQVCNLEKITKASQAINFINQQNLEAEDQDSIDLAKLKEVIDNFELASKQLTEIKDCFNESNEEYKSEEFLELLESDVGFFQQQANLFQEVSDGLADNDIEKLESALEKLEELEELEQRQIQIFSNSDYQSAFQDIFQEVILEKDRQANEKLQDYEFKISRMRSKYWFVRR